MALNRINLVGTAAHRLGTDAFMDAREPQGSDATRSISASQTEFCSALARQAEENCRRKKEADAKRRSSRDATHKHVASLGNSMLAFSNTLRAMTSCKWNGV